MSVGVIVKDSAEQLRVGVFTDPSECRVIGTRRPNDDDTLVRVFHDPVQATDGTWQNRTVVAANRIERHLNGQPLLRPEIDRAIRECIVTASGKVGP